MSSPESASGGSSSLARHFVQFYKEDARLLDEVVDFLQAALLAGDAVLIIATPGHRASIEERLSRACEAIGPPRWDRGACVAMDVDDTLQSILVEGWPDERRFDDILGGALRRLSRDGRRVVRCFGELVACLCSQGRHAAAVRLEELWCSLGSRHAFSLFCAYPLDLFSQPAQRRAFEEVCALHMHVVPADGAAARLGHSLQDLTFASLRHQSDSLEREVARRGRAEHVLLDFLEHAAEGLIRVAPDSTVEWANRAELEMLGRGIHDVVGRPLAEFHMERAQGDEFVARLREGRALADQPATYRRGDGSACHALVHSTPVLEDGRLVSTRCFARDITEAVRAREALERSQREQSQLLERLACADRAKDEFLAMLGHELRNPLAPIVTALQLMKMRGDASTAREQAIIQRQVDHLIRLVDDLLDVSRVTRGKVELHKDTVEIGDVVAKAVDMARLLLEQRRHRLVVRVPSRGLRWTGDPARLAQVVANLLTNAARYTPPGGEVRLRAFRDSGQAVIRVKDNGQGMDSETLSQVFDLFVQGARGVDRAEGGLGIGLALVKSLVALHGGTVEARSEGRGRGSEFVVRLPLGTARAVAAAPAAASALVGAGCRRVLIVDDNADAADLLGLALRALGYEVLVTHEPLAALAAAARFKPDAAVLDIGLPVIDGYELAARLRDVLGPATCRLLALTGYGRDVDRARAKAAGFEVHLVKPVDVDRLAGLLAAPATPSRH